MKSLGEILYSYGVRVYDAFRPDESQVLFKSCNHGTLVKFPKGLYCCKRCHRVYNFIGVLFGTEVKIGKTEFEKLRDLRNSKVKDEDKI